MPGILLTVFAVVAIGLAVVAAVFVLGMRMRSRRFLRFLALVGRDLLNPRQLRSAGRPGSFASIIRHRGRRTGQAYETPVGVVATADGFLIGLPYGPNTQWLQNVLAAGEATLVTEGRTVSVDRPELVPTATVASRFSAIDQRTFRLFRVTECLSLRRVEESATGSDPLARVSRAA